MLRNICVPTRLQAEDAKEEETLTYTAFMLNEGREGKRILRIRRLDKSLISYNEIKIKEFTNPGYC